MSEPIRDMSKAQFDKACQRHGFIRQGFMGYYDVGHGLSVSILNAGNRRRNQLAYLIRASEQAATKIEKTLAAFKKEEV